MFAGVAIEPDGVLQRLVVGGKIGFGEAGFAEQRIDGRGGAGGEELPGGVAPAVIAAGVDEERAGGDEGQQAVGIDRASGPEAG